jgi:endonuclease/exonuclease/phosphatase (EEP) superfamily protein YafD
MRLKLRRREIILIGSFWLLGCALLAIVVYFGVLQSQAQPLADKDFLPQATYTVVYNQTTAQSAQELAFDQVRKLWQEDAQLMAVRSTWEQTELNAVGQPSPWTYRFYSPTARQMFFITITPEGEVLGTLHTEQIFDPPKSIRMEDWVMDSSEALNIWLNYGGATMLAAMPGIQVVAQLKVNSASSPLTWTIAGYDQVSQNFLSVFIDARSKEVLQIESSLK